MRPHSETSLNPTLDQAAIHSAAATAEQDLCCPMCEHQESEASPGSVGVARGNTARFAEQQFRVWRCSNCGAISSLEPVDMADIYSDYPLNDRELDVFARATLGNLMRRLERAGMKRTDRILDYGCGNGLLVTFLRGAGYEHTVGFDPFVPEFADSPGETGGFDVVIANDVIEHVQDPAAVMRHCRDLVRPGGLLYVGTADAGGVTDMDDLEPHLMMLHQPFHRVVLTEGGLHQLGERLQLQKVASFRRSYMDTMRPFGSYRFLDEMNAALDHVMDRALQPDAARVVMRRPRLWFFGLFGYFMPSAFEPAVIWRVPTEVGGQGSGS